MADNEHELAVDILSQQILTWYKQAGEFDASNYPDRVKRAADCRAKAREVEKSIQFLLDPKQPKGDPS